MTLKIRTTEKPNWVRTKILGSGCFLFLIAFGLQCDLRLPSGFSEGASEQTVHLLNHVTSGFQDVEKSESRFENHCCVPGSECFKSSLIQLDGNFHLIRNSRRYGNEIAWQEAHSLLVFRSNLEGRFVQGEQVIGWVGEIKGDVKHQGFRIANAFPTLEFNPLLHADFLYSYLPSHQVSLSLDDKQSRQPCNARQTGTKPPIQTGRMSGLNALRQ